MKDMKKKLRECEANKKAILDEYLKCERELRLKTEETVKLKTEISDLKEIMRLSDELKDQNIDVSPNSKNESDDKVNESVNVRLTKKAGFRRSSPLFQPSPPKPAKKEKEFNEVHCLSSLSQLDRHDLFPHPPISQIIILRQICVCEMRVVIIKY